MIPVTFDAAEKLPIFSGRSRVAAQLALEMIGVHAARPRPRAIVTTSATDSRHGSSFEWCSYGPMNTTGRSRRASSSTRISVSIAAVEPDPQKSTTSSSLPPTAPWMTRRASSRNAVVCNPVADASVCVFAYSGSTRSRM